MAWDLRYHSIYLNFNPLWLLSADSSSTIIYFTEMARFIGVSFSLALQLLNDKSKQFPRWKIAEDDINSTGWWFSPKKSKKSYACQNVWKSSATFRGAQSKNIQKLSPPKSIHPGRLTWNLQINHLERKMIFQTSMIMFHVNLPGCIQLLL